MSNSSGNSISGKVSHIAKRLKQDWKITSLLKNWRELLYAKLKHSDITIPSPD